MLRRPVPARALRAVALASFLSLIAPAHALSAQPRDRKDVPEAKRDKVAQSFRAALQAAAQGDRHDDVKRIATRCKAKVGKKCGLDGMLFRAIREGKPYVAIALIQSGATPNARDADRESVLALAAERGSNAVVRALLAAGADPELRLPEGDVAMHRAAAYGRDAVIVVLAEAGAQIDVPIRSRQRRDGWTPLMVAVAEQQLPAIERLLSVGARIDTRNPRGRTALLIAAWYGAEEIVERLLRAGADPHAADVYGFTPVSMAKLIGDPLVVNYFRAAAIDRGR